MSESDDTTTTTLRVSAEVWGVLRLVAKHRGISANELVNRLLGDSVRKVGFQREAKAQLEAERKAVEGLG